MKFRNLASMLRARYGEHSREVEPNHWMFEVMTRDRRSQVVHLILKEHNIEGKDVSRVIADSPIGPVPQRADFESLLRKNAGLDVGAICIDDMEDEDGEVQPYLIIRATRVMALADEREVVEMVHEVGRVADRLESDIFARDVN